MGRRKRAVYQVLPPLGGARYGWRVVVNRTGFWTRGTKAEAVELGREKAKLVRADGGLAQLVVHGRDGRIQYEHTYGDDPRRRQG